MLPTTHIIRSNEHCRGWCRSPGDTVKKLFIVVESLRNGYGLLLGHLPTFISRHLVLVDGGPDPKELLGLWTALCQDAELSQVLAELGLLWVDGCLQCRRSSVEGDLVEKVHNALVAVTRFRKFTDSRWCTIGASCGTIVACRLLGLDRWVEVVRSDPKASDFYMHGYGQLDDNVCRYTTVASMAAPLPDGVLLGLLKDDRVARQLPVLQATVEGEQFAELLSIASLRGNTPKLHSQHLYICHISSNMCYMSTFII